MADGLKVEIITRDFSRMLAELAAIDPRVEFATVIKEVAARVVAGALRRTRSAEAGRIRATFATKEWTSFGGKRYKIDEWLLPNPLWRQIQHFRKERLQTKLNSRGLSKQSWLHVASAFGKTIAAPSFVQNANYRGRQYPVDGDKSEEGSGTNYALTIINSSPIVQAASGRSALIAAMAGETGYFRRNMENRAFATIESRAKKYPGIFTSGVPAAAAA